MHQNADTKNKTKKPFQKISSDRTAAKCYMLNDASLGIHCTKIPKSMEIDDAIKFFNVYGEIDSIGYEPKKGSCDVIYYDIRSSIAAFIALQNYSFDKKHILRLNFIGMDFLKEIQKTPFVILKLVDNHDQFTKKDEIEHFARSYGDFHLVEQAENGEFIIYFYDSRQCNQCISKPNVEFSNKFKYTIYPYYNFLNQSADTSQKKRKNVSQIQTKKLDEFNDKLEDSFSDKDIKIYIPAPGQNKSFHCRLFLSLFKKQALQDSMKKDSALKS